MRAGVAIALGAGLMSTAAGAVNIAQDGIGEVAVAPYYTVRDGWLTTFNLTNTGPEPIAVKVRFKEHRNGRDVLNFTIALAAQDVFAGVVREARNGSGPVLLASDQAAYDGRRTCTVPASIAEPDKETSFSTRGFGPPGTANDDGGPSGGDEDAIDRLREGHIEFMVMGYAEGSDEGVGGGSPGRVGSAIASFNCAAVERAFGYEEAGTSGRTHILNTARQFGEPINVLKVSYGLLHPARGIEVDGVPTVWANFYNRDAGPKAARITPEENAGCQRERAANQVDDLAWWWPDGTAGSCRNLIAGMSLGQAWAESKGSPWPDLEPTLNDAYPPIANWWDDERVYPSSARPTAMSIRRQEPSGNQGGQQPDLVPVQRGIDALSLTIQRVAVINEWSGNDALGVATDWILSMPTKGFYVDDGDDRGRPEPAAYAALNAHRSTVYLVDGTDGQADAGYTEVPLPYAPFMQAFRQYAEGTRESAGACQQFSYDWHQQYDRVGRREGSPVGILPPILRLCDSANVLISGERVVLGASRPQGEVNGFLPVYQSIGSVGWTKMQMGELAVRTVQVGPYFDGAVEDHRGLPVIGFAVKQRSFGSVTRNYASSIPHSYVREAVAVQ